MLKQLIEFASGQLSQAELREVLDLATLDINNRVGYNERTYLGDVAEIAGICLGIMRMCTYEPFPRGHENGCLAIVGR